MFDYGTDLVVGAWSYLDVTYTATEAAAAPQIVSPIVGSVVDDTVVDFEWTDNDSGADEYWVYAGATPGSRSYFDSGNVGANESVELSELPSDGTQIYVRLWHRSGGFGRWRFVDAEYTATGTLPIIRTPTPGDRLSGAASSFHWIDNGVAAVAYWLYAGSVLGARDYYDSGFLGSSQTTTAVNLPVDGTPVYIRLWFRLSEAGQWKFRDFTYLAAR